MNAVQFQIPLPLLGDVPSQKLTWDVAAPSYLTHKKETGSPDSSITAFKQDLHILASFISYPTDLTAPREAKRILNELGEIYAPSTVARRHSTWRAFYRYLRDSGHISESPFRFGFDATPYENKALQFLTPAQTRLLFAAASAIEDPAPAFIARLGLYTGFKPSNLHALTVADIAADEQCVYLHTPTDTRVAPVPTDLFPLYDDYEQLYLPDASRDDPLFPFTQRWMELRLATAAADCKADVGFAPTFSTLRWTRIIYDLRAGVSASRLRAKLGLTDLGWRIHVAPRVRACIPAPAETGDVPLS